jgi:hypothetical protein
MRVVLINPNLLVLPTDPFTTGVVRMPIGLASVAAALRRSGADVTILDAYGQRPGQVWNDEPFLVFGLEHEELAGLVPPETDLIFLYAHQASQAHLLPGILAALEQAHPDLAVIVLENTQAQPAFPLEPLSDLLLDSGAGAILCGEPELSAVRLVRALVEQTESMHQIPGLRGGGLVNPLGDLPDLDNLPFPAWDLVPLRNYWGSHFAPGPLSNGRYLPIQLSRSTPTTGRLALVSEDAPPTWRCRSPEHVVEEIAHLRTTFKVGEFHIEDVAPLQDDGWWDDFCGVLGRKPWSVQWKIVNPCHLEALSEGTLVRMARAGCRYLAFHLDARSIRGVPLALPAWIDVFHRVGEMNRIGILSGACLDPGWPDDREMDQVLLGQLVHDLAKSGLDEMDLSSQPESRRTPEPYSAEGEGLVKGSAEYELARLRTDLSRQFLGWKLRYHPWKVVRQGVNLLLRRFETKMEMAAYRAAMHRWHALWVRRPAEPAPEAEHEEVPAQTGKAA